MQLDVIVDCGCEEVDIIDVDVRIFPFCPPPVSQIPFLSTTCESDPGVAEKRARCVAGGKL